MSETVQDDTFTLTLDDHDFVFRKLSAAHLTMWQIYIASWRKKHEKADPEVSSAGLQDLIVKALDVAQDKLVNEADKDLITDKLLMGRVEYTEIFAVFRNGVTADAVADDADVKPVKKTAAPKKAPTRARVKR